VTETARQSYAPRLRRLIACAIVLATPVVAGAAVSIALDPPGAGEATAILLFLGLALLAELKPVPLEVEGMSSVSLAFVFILSGLILFGWETAVLIAFVSAVAAQLVERRPLSRLAFNGAVYALSAFAAAMPAFFYGGDGAHDTGVTILFAVWGGAAFVAVNVAFVSLAISFHHGVPLLPLLREDSRLIGPAFGIQACLAALAASLWTIDARLLVLMAGPLFTVVLYQRSSLASRIAKRDAHTDSLTLVGNNRAYELRLASALEEARVSASLLSLCLVDVDNFKQINDLHGHPLGDEVLVQVAGLLEAPGESRAFRLGGDEFAVLVDGGRETARREIEALYLNISNAEFPHGATATVSVGIATYPDDAESAEELERKADGALYWAKHSGKNRLCLFDPVLVPSYSGDDVERRAEIAARLRAAENLARVVDMKDAYTGAHSERVALFVEGIARRLGLDAVLVEQLKLAGRLHDLGKIAVPDQVLQKPGSLTPDEELKLSAHPELGASLLDGMDIRPVDLWIRHHHENWDGSGYPDGLAAEEIPFGSRVILVADAYDAMTTERSYRPASSPEAALEELERMAGIQFDPVIVAALKAHLVEAGLLAEPPQRPAVRLVA
jgi:diguanylate cyclase (GGDEF)-like protein